ncbi:MAG: DUF4412 domain-containing protein [Nitrospiraceae bacterium]
MGMFRGMVLGSVLIGLAGPAWAENFEGIVHFKSTHDGKTREYDYLIKGNKARIELGGAEGNRQFAVVVDPENKKTLMLMPERKMVMEMPMEEGKTDQPASGKKHVSFTRTGKTDTILGHTCEQMLVKVEDTETEICGARGMGYYAGMHRPSMGGPSDSAPAWAKELKEQGFFPLRVVSKGSDGTEKTRLEATKVEQKTLDTSLFSAPPDYKAFDRGNMGGYGGPGSMGKRKPGGE